MQAFNVRIVLDSEKPVALEAINDVVQTGFIALGFQDSEPMIEVEELG